MAGIEGTGGENLVQQSLPGVSEGDPSEDCQ